jgi:hypothetical protein
MRRHRDDLAIKPICPSNVPHHYRSRQTHHLLCSVTERVILTPFRSRPSISDEEAVVSGPCAAQGNRCTVSPLHRVELARREGSLTKGTCTMRRHHCTYSSQHQSAFLITPCITIDIHNRSDDETSWRRNASVNR